MYKYLVAFDMTTALGAPATGRCFVNREHPITSEEDVYEMEKAIIEENETDVEKLFVTHFQLMDIEYGLEDVEDDEELDENISADSHTITWGELFEAVNKRLSPLGYDLFSINSGNCPKYKGLAAAEAMAGCLVVLRNSTGG